jgi:hypothetical protein
MTKVTNEMINSYKNILRDNFDIDYPVSGEIDYKRERDMVYDTKSLALDLHDVEGDVMDEIAMSKERKDELIKLAVSIRGELEVYIDNFSEIDFNTELSDYENKVKEVFNMYHLFSILSCQCKCRNRPDNNIECGECCRRHLTASKYSIDGDNKYFNTFKMIR